MSDARRYVRDLKARSKEIRRLAREQVADEKERDRVSAMELEKLRLHEISEIKSIEKEIEAKRLEASVGLAKDALLLCLSETSPSPDLNISELVQMRADAKSCCQKFRMASLALATILGDRYNGEHREYEQTISERAYNKISELTKFDMGKAGNPG